MQAPTVSSAFRIPLVAAKLAPPALPHGYVARARLSDRLDAALRDATRLTVVSTEPGYGKSVAVAGWLTSRNVPAAWLSLESADNDLVRFARYLVAALRNVRPDTGDATLDLLTAGTRPSVEQVGATLLDEIAASDETFVLVLDDYHMVEAEDVHRLVAFLVAGLPPFAHPIVVTREDPPLPLARLRAHARLLELRSADLRFTAGETASYLDESTALHMAPGAVETLAERTEGWAAGLQLAALALRDRTDPDAAVEALTSSRRALFDYLADEVVAGLDGELRGFLVGISLAGSLTPELCDELTGRRDAADLLRRAEQANLFVVPVDADGRTYRMHQLFAAYLRSQIPPQQRVLLHDAIAAHLERRGQIEEAIDHSLAAGSLDRAVRLLERQARSTFEAGELTTLLGWLAALPAERVLASPELASLQAWSLMFLGRLGEAVAVVTNRRAVVGGAGNDPAEGRLLALQSLVAAVTGPAPTGAGSSAPELGEAASDLLGQDEFFRAIALQSVGMATWSGGDFARGFELWQEAHRAATRSGQPMVVLLATAALAGGLNDLGRRPEAEALCRRTLAEFVDRRGKPRPIAWLITMTLGLLRYEADDVREGLADLERAFDMAGSYGFGGAMVVWAVEYLALARQASGWPAGALEALRISALGVESAGVALPSQIAEYEARINLMQGNLAAAGLWADHARLDAPPGSPMLGQMQADQDVAVARVRLAQGRAPEAEELLSRARARAERLGAVADLITIRTLEAGALVATGRRAAAQRALEEAIRLAAPGRYLRRVIDDAGPAAKLLPLVRHVAPDFVDPVTSALGAGRGLPGVPTAAEISAAAAESARQRLLEKLTARELDVLRLMAQGASDAEIAAGLFVSLATARWHAANVRAKLGAKNRTQALLRAQELGLI